MDIKRLIRMAAGGLIAAALWRWVFAHAAKWPFGWLLSPKSPWFFIFLCCLIMILERNRHIQEFLSDIILGLIALPSLDFLLKQ